MVKKLTKKFKDIRVEITFAEPQEYDSKKDIDKAHRNTTKKCCKSTQKKRTARKARVKRRSEH